MKLAEILRRYRKENAVSMDALAAKANLSKGYISMIESGKNARDNKPISPTLATLSKLAAAMGMSLDDLLRLMDSDSNIVVNENAKSQSLRPDELDILAAYNALNRNGRADALQKLLDMAEITRYREDTPLREELAK